MRLERLRMWRFHREHRWTHAHLPEYLDEELPEGDRQRVEAHTGLCPQCRHVLATLRQTLQGLRTLGAQPAGDGVSEAVIERLRREG